MAAFGVGSMPGTVPDGTSTPTRPSTGDFIIVYFLDKQPVGTEFLRRRDEWPLHITLVPCFEASAPRKLIAGLGATKAQLQPFEAVLGAEEQFNDQTRVTLLKKPAAMSSLGDKLVIVVE